MTDNPFTPREMHVLHYIVAGKANKEIASILGTSPKTVETQVTNMLNKVDRNSKLQLALYSIRMGIIPLGKEVEL